MWPAGKEHLGRNEEHLGAVSQARGALTLWCDVRADSKHRWPIRVQTCSGDGEEAQSMPLLHTNAGI